MESFCRKFKIVKVKERKLAIVVICFVVNDRCVLIFKMSSILEQRYSLSYHNTATSACEGKDAFIGPGLDAGPLNCFGR